MALANLSNSVDVYAMYDAVGSLWECHPPRRLARIFFDYYGVSVARSLTLCCFFFFAIHARLSAVAAKRFPIV